MSGFARALVIVEDGALVKERGLGGIQIFGLRLLGDCAATKGDDPALQIANRKNNAVAKTVIGDRNALAMNQKPAFDHRLERHALASEMVPYVIFFRAGIA